MGAAARMGGGAMRSRPVRTGCVGVLAALAWLIAAGVAAAASAGTVRVAVSGLPSGEHPSGTLSGPGVHRRLSSAAMTVRRAKPGLWTLRMSVVHMRHGHDPLKRGAAASPVARVVRVRLKPGGHVTVRGRYGTMVNPGLVQLAGGGGVIRVSGPAGNPAAVTFAGDRAFHVGQVLSLAPSSVLPHGLLARVVSVARRSGRTTVRVRAVSPFAVVPVASFHNVRLHALGTARDVFAPNATKVSCQSGPTNLGVWRRCRTCAYLAGGTRFGCSASALRSAFMFRLTWMSRRA